ncbi:G-protein coupled receptor 2-like protein [Drosera capensis]
MRNLLQSSNSTAIEDGGGGISGYSQAELSEAVDCEITWECTPGKESAWNILSLFTTSGMLFLEVSLIAFLLKARPAFHKYVVVMFSINVAALFACDLTGNGAGFGFWLYDTTVICYHAFYLPLLYVTFLADFFQEDDLNLENVYYEMKDAGFFDTEWD